MVSIFVSYCQKDRVYADEIDSYFKDTNVNIVRDIREISSFNSIRQYMKSIRDMEYAILIITDNYLKSFNCMFEVMEVMKEKGFENKIFPLLYETSIYLPIERIKYINFWQNEYNKLDTELNSINRIDSISISKNLKEIREIKSTMDDFLALVSDMNNPKITDVYKEIELYLRTQNINVERNRFNSKIIPVVSPAGGVGNSTVAGCLSYILQNYFHKKILCISLGSLDHAQLMLGMYKKNEMSVYVAEDVTAYKSPCGVDFIYRKQISNYFKTQKSNISSLNWMELIKVIIERNHYDFVIVDCGSVSTECYGEDIVNLADNIIVPLGNSMWSGRGLIRIGSMIETENFKNLWLLNSIGMYVGRDSIQNIIHREYVETKDTLKNKDNIEVREFSTVIPKTVKVNEIIWEREILLESQKLMKVKSAYIDLAKEVLEKFA